MRLHKHGETRSENNVFLVSTCSQRTHAHLPIRNHHHQVEYGTAGWGLGFEFYALLATGLRSEGGTEYRAFSVDDNFGIVNLKRQLIVLAEWVLQ